MKMSRGPFLGGGGLVTFRNLWNLFGSTKMENFYQEKAYFTLGKNLEN